MMNQDNPYAMNQTCKVCGEPAAGFHFGAFTCEGCKSFFGRSYNNLSSISECKNNGECIINKKNRTACKACRLRKCVLVGMSKSGSRYGRRSNWFKIHCLLQEQQQQAAAVMAAHHNNQQQAAAAAAAAQQHGAHGQKPPGGPSSAAAAAALGMLGHAGAYPGLYPPRTKEELMMLGLEEYAKHPAASPSVSSPDSHNSDSSVEVNVRGNALLHLSGKHLEPGVGGSASSGTPPHLRKDLPPFLPLHFPGLNAMPVMPPPAFLPPSHLLFPGYHPALYQHHQSLLKHSPEQQQAVAAAAAVQHLFNSNNAGAQHRFSPAASSVANSNVALNSLPLAAESHEQDERTAPSPKSDALNNNHIPNGSKAADELTKRFYLDAVLKSQRSSSPPPAATKIPTHSKHDHSISALVTPNSESGRERLKSRQSNEEDGAVADEDVDAVETQSHGEHDSDCGDVVVSMTPPRSPANARTDPVEQSQPPAVALNSQDNPIDLSMKTGSSMVSSLSSKCSSTGSMQAIDSENEQEADMAEAIVAGKSDNCQKKNGETYGVAFSSEGETAALNVNDERSNGSANDTHSNSLHYNNNNNNNNSKESTIVADSDSEIVECAKRKAEVSCSGETMLAATASVKRMKIELEALEPTAVKAATTTPLDLTTKV